MMMMMMMIMIAGLVDSIATPIKAWLNHHHHNHKTTNIKVEDLSLHGSAVECIVCLSKVAVGEKYAMLTRCRHGFHVECLEAWLKDHSNCPLCRTPVSAPHEDNIYLKKVYDIITCYAICAIESMSCWLTKPFNQDLQSTLSQSCNYM